MRLNWFELLLLVILAIFVQTVHAEGAPSVMLQDNHQMAHKKGFLPGKNVWKKGNLGAYSPSSLQHN